MGAMICILMGRTHLIVIQWVTIFLSYKKKMVRERMTTCRHPAPGIKKGVMIPVGRVPVIDNA